MAHENLSAIERIIQALITHADHLYHGRPGLVRIDPSATVGVTWLAVSHQEENGIKTVTELRKVGKATTRVPLGTLAADGRVRDATGRNVGEYRPAGLFPEVAAWMYGKVAEVWALDNELAARWASYAYAQDHRDLKVVLAAFMLVQSRHGEPVFEQGKVALRDEDYRDVGEAMLLRLERGVESMNPKLLLRVGEFLALPAVAAINRGLGFGKSARKPFLGRWPKAVEKWLAYREDNPQLLEGLVKAGFRRTVMELARRVGYRPRTPSFFQKLRWKQVQAKDGRRTIAIGLAVTAAESWAELGEVAICERIVATKPDFKRIVGLVPASVGLTRAIVAAAIEAGSLSNKDLIIQTPTLEELGLLSVPTLRERWERAVKQAEDLRAANVALRVRSKAVQEKLTEAADNALKHAVEAVMRGIRVYFFVDVSGSMAHSIEAAKVLLARFVQGFPLEHIHVCVFNTAAREIRIPYASAVGITQAFKGIGASGGTDYGSGVRVLLHDHPPLPDEDVLFVFVGDEGQRGRFDDVVRQAGATPLAFGFVKLPGDPGAIVTDTAAALGIPCFQIREDTFADPYAIPRTIRALVAATPVGRIGATSAPRVSLVDQILKTDLLTKPLWAA